jgi:VIT1/CCC1 family predicted Fe2+/Mn2+ transporter
MSGESSIAALWRLVWPGSRPALELRAAPHPLDQPGVAPVTACDADAVHPRVMAEFAQGKQRIAGRVDDLKALTEREVLACGNVLSSIVDNVRELIAETDRMAAASMARSEEVASTFVRGMQEDILAQEAAVKQVLLMADGIEDAIGAINGLTESSNILAINASIEAARLGAQGRGFAVIAEYMRQLSETIRVAADRVRSSIGAVRQGLPPVMQRATSMHDRTRSFIDIVAEQVKHASLQTDAGSVGSGRLDTVMELSNTGLSHLQFQDPLVQKLTSINRDLDVLEGRMGRVLDGEADLAAAQYDQSPSGAEPTPGKMVLF